MIESDDIPHDQFLDQFVYTMRYVKTGFVYNGQIIEEDKNVKYIIKSFFLLKLLIGLILSKIVL